MSWETATVGSISTQIRGVTYDKADLSSGSSDKYITLLRAGNIQSGELMLDDLVYVDRNKVASKQFLKSGDVLVAASSGSLSMVGKAARVRENQYAAFGAFCKVLRPDISKVDKNYFGHFFQTGAYRNTISALAQGANINNIRGEHLDDLEIPLPPLPVQQRIAAVLDEVDALRQKRERSVDNARKMKTSLYISMFGEPLSVASHAQTISLGEIAQDVSYGTSEKSDADPSAGLPILRIPNVIADKLNLSNLKYGTVEPRAKMADGDILFVRTNGNPDLIGRCAVFDQKDEMGFASYLIRVRLDSDADFDPVFLQSTFGMPSYRRYISSQARTTAGNFNLSAESIRSFPVKITKRKEQESFIGRVREVDDILVYLRKSDAEIATLAAALQSRAFSDELVLRDLEAAL